MQEKPKPMVLHVGPVPDVCAERYRPHLAVHAIAPGAIPEAGLAGEAQALIAAAPVSAALIAALPRLRLIAAFGVGVDRIDLAAARARGVAVTNSPGVSDGCAFARGRDMAAWLGLVPRQYSTGGKERLLGISKRGDSYLRKLLIHGARATIRWVGRKTDRRSQWIRQLVERRGKNRTAVAIANKNARIVWALLTSHQVYEPAKG